MESLGRWAKQWKKIPWPFTSLNERDPVLQAGEDIALDVAQKTLMEASTLIEVATMFVVPALRWLMTEADWRCLVNHLVYLLSFLFCNRCSHILERTPRSACWACVKALSWSPKFRPQNLFQTHDTLPALAPQILKLQAKDAWLVSPVFKVLLLPGPWPRFLPLSMYPHMRHVSSLKSGWSRLKFFMWVGFLLAYRLSHS